MQHYVLRNNVAKIMLCCFSESSTPTYRRAFYWLTHSCSNSVFYKNGILICPASQIFISFPLASVACELFGEFAVRLTHLEFSKGRDEDVAVPWLCTQWTAVGFHAGPSQAHALHCRVFPVIMEELLNYCMTFVRDEYTSKYFCKGIYLTNMGKTV